MRKLTIFSLLIVLLLTACNEKAGAAQPGETKEKETAVEKQIETEENVTVDEKEETEQAYTETFPLTGEPAVDKADHRALAVMVNNHPKARPQSGLSQADIVYEILAEGQITRFLALFHSEIPDTIGPVRSARPYYFKIADGFDALYAYHGASTAINQQVASSGIDYLDGAMYDNNGWLFQRSSDRSAPHNSYLLTEGVEQAAATKGYDAEEAPETLSFTEKDSFDGTPVDDVQVTYGSRTNVRFTYDSEKEQFLRSSDGEPTIDRLNEERVAVENVWIIETGHQIIDGAGRRAIDLTSGGNGYLLQKGQMKEVEWKNVDGRLLPYKDGSPQAFTPGKTWVNIIPGNAAVETE
ncbi:DUF3048 domain-containing protein [Halobacillus sp. GSS1]|nr:DUF3048 domain-containing protein [Halobacillus sp. GSS1]